MQLALMFFVQDKNECKAAIWAVYLSKNCVTGVPFSDPQGIPKPGVI